VILAKTLAKKPTSKIDIHLIDIENTGYTACLEWLNNSRNVQSIGISNIKSIEKKLIPYAKEHWQAKNESKDRLQN
jgi:hypothetical protein